MNLQNTKEISRRQFVALAAGCAAACSCAGMASGAPSSSEPFDVGPASDYAKSGISDKFVRSHAVFITREDKKIYASTSVCPHRGATLKVRGSEIWCPKHGSEFDADGAVTKGPAETSLERYAISKNDAGHLIVDPSKSFREKNWTDPASFVAV